VCSTELRRAGAWERRGGACAARRRRPDPVSDPEPAARCGGAVRRRRRRGTRLVQHREAAAKPVQPGVEIVRQRVGVGRRRGAWTQAAQRILRLSEPRQPQRAGRRGQQQKQSCRAPHGARWWDGGARLRHTHVLLTSWSRSSPFCVVATRYLSQVSYFSGTTSRDACAVCVSGQRSNASASQGKRQTRNVHSPTLLSSFGARFLGKQTVHAYPLSGAHVAAGLRRLFGVALRRSACLRRRTPPQCAAASRGAPTRMPAPHRRCCGRRRGLRAARRRPLCKVRCTARLGQRPRRRSLDVA
jgi:hypothetical protein